MDSETKKGLLGWLVAAVAVIALVSSCSKSEEKIEPTVKRESLSDADLLRYTKRQIESIENDSEQDVTALMSIAQKRPQRSAEVFVAALAKAIQTLDRSESVIAPNLANVSARGHVAEAVEAHKKWSLLRKAQFGAIIETDMAKMLSIKTQIDQQSMTEALGLLMAYKDLGIEP